MLVVENQELIKISELDKVSEIKDSILNYNRLNPNLNFNNFIEGKSNDIALSYSKKICENILEDKTKIETPTTSPTAVCYRLARW